MSANIYWEPASRKRNDLNVGAASAFMTMLEKAGITNRVTTADLPVLRGMEAAAPDGFKGPLQEMIDAVEKHDEIEWRAEY